MVDLRQCKKCVYRTYIGRATGCGYLFYTGRSRISQDGFGENTCSVFMPARGNGDLRKKLINKAKRAGDKPLYE